MAVAGTVAVLASRVDHGCRAAGRGATRVPAGGASGAVASGTESGVAPGVLALGVPAGGRAAGLALELPTRGFGVGATRMSPAGLGTGVTSRILGLGVAATRGRVPFKSGGLAVPIRGRAGSDAG